jgi:Carbohydrate esterase, sialic acid-specific acetylesterase
LSVLGGFFIENPSHFMKTRILPLVVLLKLLLISASPAEVSVSGQDSSDVLNYSGETSSTDLINAGQSTLLSATVSATSYGFPGTGINDGNYSDTVADNTFFAVELGAFPATATYDLNVSVNVLGYDITSIKSLMGWATVSAAQANQTYTIEVSTVGSASYTPLATVSYKPFNDTNSPTAYETMVTVSDTGGVLATGVDSIRFTFTDPIGVNGVTPGSGETEGTLIREIDVSGNPTSGEANSSTALAYAGQTSTTDLINAGQSTLSSATVSAVYNGGSPFPATGINNGNYSDTFTDNTFFHRGEGNFPATATYDLNVSVNVLGYDLTSINSFMGWATVSAAQANQTYTIEVSAVGSATYTPLATVSYKPFNDTNSPTAYETMVTVSHTGGVLATGVDSIRFTFTDPIGVNGVPDGSGTTEGTLIREIDVFGVPTTGTPVTPTIVTISGPTSRHIVQRSSGNTGNLGVSGTYTGAPERIEARAVVMGGAGNSGTSTDWQTIQTSPGGGSFTGTLTDVAAGGWYQLEVRAITAGSPGAVATLTKVGVGDIYLTAGQSNSANYGGSAYTPADDRVSTRTSVSAASWRQGYDPQPLAGGTGGSVWSRLGDQLAAADDIPIGFICVGVGATQVSQWVPGTANYDNLLKPALQSLGASGCRAVLWHQGESDSLASVTAITHATRLNSMITQSRTDAGWTVPWYLAEASFHPDSNLTQEEPVCAGQRLAVFGDANVFLGPTTDAFHLEDAAGGKLSDSVHFNAAGLSDHATQWRDILRGTTTATPRNGNFEDNRDPAITGLTALADGAGHVVDISNLDSPSVIGWRVLSANGQTAADGSNGFHNPTTGTYAAAIDTTNSGVLPHMDGRHVAVLDGGSANNSFLHTTRATLDPNTRYTLTVALGVRDIASTFGNARLDILADGIVVATATFDKSALDALHGGDASGSFNDATLSYVTGASVTPNQSLALRIAKVGGVSTVLDFDNVRFSAHTGYEAYQMRYWGSTTHPDSSESLDPDNDGLTNQQEFAFGLNPISGSSVNPILVALNKTTGQFSYQRLAASGLTYRILTSTTLAADSWTEDVDATAAQVAGATDGNGNQTVVVTLSGAPLTEPKRFVRVAAD